MPPLLHNDAAQLNRANDTTTRGEMDGSLTHGRRRRSCVSDRVTALSFRDLRLGDGMRCVRLRTEVVEPVFTAVRVVRNAERLAKCRNKLGAGHALAHRCADEARSRRGAGGKDRGDSECDQMNGASHGMGCEMGCCLGRRYTGEIGNSGTINVPVPRRLVECVRIGGLRVLRWCTSLLCQGVPHRERMRTDSHGRSSRGAYERIR